MCDTAGGAGVETQRGGRDSTTRRDGSDAEGSQSAADGSARTFPRRRGSARKSRLRTRASVSSPLYKYLAIIQQKLTNQSINQSIEVALVAELLQG